MTKLGRSVIAVLVVGILVAGVSGCKKKEGPMEQTGRAIDNAAEKSGQKVDKAVEKAGKQIEKAGDKIQDSVK